MRPHHGHHTRTHAPSRPWIHLTHRPRTPSKWGRSPAPCAAIIARLGYEAKVRLLSGQGGWRGRAFDGRSRAHLDGLRPDLLQPLGPKVLGDDCRKDQRILRRTRAYTWTDGVSSEHVGSTRGAHAERSVHAATSSCSRRSWAAEGAYYACRYRRPSAVDRTKRRDRSLHLRGRRDSAATNDTLGESRHHVMVRGGMRAHAG